MANIIRTTEQACKDGDVNAVKEFLSVHYASVVNNVSIQSLVMTACLNGHLDVVKCFFDYPRTRYLVNDSDSIREFLKISADKGYLDITKYLLTEPDLHRKEDDSLISLAALFAVGGGHLDTIKYLIDNFLDSEKLQTYIDGGNLFRATYEYNNLEILKYLIHEPKLKEKTAEYVTDLEFLKIVDAGNLEIIRYFIFDLNIEHNSVIKFSLKHNKNPINETVNNWFKLRELNQTLNDELVNNTSLHDNNSKKIKV